MAIKLWGLFGFLAGLLCFMCSCSSSSVRSNSGIKSPGYQTITAEAAYKMMKESNDYILLDVRTEHEFKEKHIDGAILMPFYDVKNRAEAELTDKNAKILIYCRGGAMSAGAAKTLVDKGYTQVISFGGIQTWPYETVSGN
jgi:rhodanese-related sulfurtransferase